MTADKPPPLAYRGKIAKLPPAIRDQVNARLERSESGVKICRWLNSLPEAKALCKAEFNGEPITGQNLSDYRRGAYAEWRRMMAGCQKDAQALQTITAATVELVKASNGKLDETLVNATAARLLLVLKDVTPDKLTEMSGAAAQLRAVTLRAQELAVKVDSQKLAREEFETRFCQDQINGIKDAEAQRIASLNASNDEKISLLRKHYFADVDALQKSGAVKLPD